MIKEEDIDVNLQKKIKIINVPIVKTVLKMYDWTTTIHADIPQSTIDAMHSDIPKLYIGLHKSLWETMGIPVVIVRQGLELPYVVMGANLVGGKIAGAFMKANGCIYVERAAKVQSEQDYSSALEIKKKITIGLDRGESVLIFPTDGRTKDGQTNFFYSTPFDAALAHLKNGPVHIIPVEVDYERLNDMPRMLKCIEQNKSYTFKANHFLDWWKNLGDVYVNFGEPIEINKNTNRKKINRYTLEKAKELTKILPVNVFSEAALRFKKNRGYFKYTMEQVIDDLKLHRDKFTGFNNIDDVINNSGLTLNEPERAYIIYSGYIKHYLPKE